MEKLRAAIDSVLGFECMNDEERIAWVNNWPARLERVIRDRDAARRAAAPITRRTLEVSQRAAKVRARLCKLGPARGVRLSRDEVGAVLDLIGEANVALNRAEGFDTATEAHSREQSLRKTAEDRLERAVLADSFEERKKLWDQYQDWKKTVER